MIAVFKRLLANFAAESAADFAAKPSADANAYVVAEISRSFQSLEAPSALGRRVPCFDAHGPCTNANLGQQQALSCGADAASESHFVDRCTSRHCGWTNRFARASTDASGALAYVLAQPRRLGLAHRADMEVADRPHDGTLDLACS